MKKVILLLTVCAMVLALCACGPTAPTQESSGPSASTGHTQAPETTAPPESAASTMIDPSGAEIHVPETIDSIVVLAPSLAETVVALGLGDKIVGYDLNSVGLEGLPAGVDTFDTVSPDMERLMALLPDVLLVSSLSLYDQEAPYQPLIDAGVCVICVPTSDSIADVKYDLQFLADALHAQAAGETVLAELNAELDRLAAIAATIPESEKKRVYFEISAAPYLYSCGSGVYLNEMIEWIGAENVLADQTGWLSLEAETVVAADPDVILTNVNYLDDPTQEILSREGWAGITAIQNGQVYYIDNMSSSLPNQNIVVAMRQMAQAIYPAYFSGE